MQEIYTDLERKKMRVELVIGEDENGLETHVLVIDDEIYAEISDLSDCPEDAHIGRDLIDGRDLITYINIGYEAAKRGLELEIKYTNEK